VDGGGGAVDDADVSSVVDGEPVVVHGPEDGRQELDVVVAGEGEQDVAADADAGGLHLAGAGGEVPAVAPRMAEVLVWAGLPAGEDPLVEELLEL
jgi:hypothetical protein